jgi:hypothetical protein
MTWRAGSLLAATRVLLLAHWASDVAGLVIGNGLERCLVRIYWMPNARGGQRQTHSANGLTTGRSTDGEA